MSQTDPFEKDAAEIMRQGLISGDELRGRRTAVPPSLGPFRIVRLLGQGGLGDVYLAEDSSVKQNVALKILRDLAPAHLERFMREAKLAASLDHPNIARIYGAGEIEGFHYISMQYIDGAPIDEARASVVECIRQIALAAHYAHGLGVIHRDITPSNILVDRAGRPFLVDFGLAKPIQQEGPGRSVTGTVLGTPAFMSPEQARGEVRRVDARTDVYGLGATLYSLLSGRTPFPDEAIYATIRRVIEEDPPPLDRSIPSELSLIVFKAMEKEMNRRYATAEAFADDLKRYQEGRPIAAHPPSLLYRLRKRLRRNKPLVAGVLIAVAMGALVIPGWLHERQTREVQLESLRELSGLWNEVTVARQGWYQAQKDPVKTRAQIEKCVGAIGDYITRYPSQPQGYYVRAQAQLYLGELDAAREDLEKATRLDPQFAPGWALLGRVLLEIYQGLLFSSRTKTSKAILDRANPTLKSAEQAFEKGWRGGAERISIKTWGLARMDEDGVAETLAKALSIRFVEHDNDRSRKLIEEAQRSAPSEEYCYLLGLWEKDLAKEVEWQTKALEIMPHYAKAFVERGFARWKLGDTARSIEDFSRALAVQPRHVAAWVNRGCVLLATGEAGPAVADLSQALQINPKLAIAYSDRSWGKVLLKDYEGAVADALRAIELEPKFIEAYANLSVARSRQGKYTEALDAANKAIAIEPRAEVYLNRALARTGLGEISAAIEDCTKALELHPNLEEALLNRALLRESLAAKSDKPEELLRLAEADAAKAVEQGGANKKFAEATLKRLRQKLSRDY